VQFQPGMVVHVYNPSTLEYEAGGSKVGGQPGLHNEILSQEKKGGRKEKKNSQILWL
jgi:hypothetical protein